MKRNASSLIRDVFPDLTTVELNGLPDVDTQQLASAIARQQGLRPEQIDFDIVQY